MKQISAAKYCEGVTSIYIEQPVYEEGHDGSDGKCDCIGMCRGGLERGGATDIKGMRGTNQAARQTIQNLQTIDSEDQLMVGDVVLKTRDKDDPNMPLPDRYRKGGIDYDAKWGETNFTHIGTVTNINPLEITHMTSPTAKIDTKLKGWTYLGELPWIQYDAAPEPEPEPDPEPEPEMAIVVAENGDTVKMRAKPTQSCKLWWSVPVGSEVIVDQWVAAVDKIGQEWSKITWDDKEGYMMKEFLCEEEKAPWDPEPDPEWPAIEEDESQQWTVTIPGLSIEQAEAICRSWRGATMERG